MKTVVLASTSPRRKELLAMTGIPFVVDAGDYEEDMTQDLHPRDLVQNLALGKAQSVAGRHPDSIIIGSDLVISIDDVVLGKPRSLEHAREMLRLLSGKSHSALCGYAIVDTATQRVVQEVVETKVFFRTMSDIEIEEYIATEEPFGKAGGYAIQGAGSMFIEKIEGDYNCVMGLPLCSLVRSLGEFGVKPFVPVEVL